MYRYIEINKKIRFKTFIKDGLKFIFPILIAIMMSGVLILPSFYALLTSRPEITSDINILNLFIPKINLSEVLYHSYSIGLTSIFVIAIIYAFFTKNVISIHKQTGYIINFLSFFLKYANKLIRTINTSKINT